MIDFFVRVVRFPRGVPCHGMVTPNDDGTFSVYIDANAAEEQQRRAYDHEVGHIVRDDFFDGKPIEEVEAI